MNKKIILMKVTSRERPDTLLKTISEYIRLASDTRNMVWLFSFDEDDRTATELFRLKLSDLFINWNHHFYFSPPSNKIAAINSDVDKVPECWHILLNISDDQIPIRQGYDDQIRNLMPNDLDASLWFNDGWQDRINTQEIVGRKYYERFGYIYNPIYKSFFCDNEATEVAQSLGLLHKHECIIKHFHPGWNKASHIKHDALYLHNNKYWIEDEITFKARKLCNYQELK